MVKFILLMIAVVGFVEAECPCRAPKEQAMNYTTEKREKKLVIGISVRTSNATYHQEALPLSGRFYQEGWVEKIPHRVGDQFLEVYTEYEGDYTKPYTYIVGCEVSSLDEIPEGMVGVEIPVSTYRVYTATGAFPQSIIQAWQAIWNSKERRSYTTDFVVYEPDFAVQKSPEIKIFISSPSSPVHRG